MELSWRWVFLFLGNFNDGCSERNESTARRTAETREKSLGGARGNPSFAKQGFSSIPKEWIGTYFRWWGVYTQGDGNGVVGGQNGEGKALPYFMVRIRIPNGILTSRQLRTIAQVTDQYARGTADLTVRQNIQLHWVTIEALPELMEALWEANLNTLGACGDVTRNVTGCPVAGIDNEELCDASPLAFDITNALAGNSELTICPASSRSALQGAAHGAHIRRSTMLG